MKKINNQNPFTTPENYFEGFTHKLLENLPEESTAIPKKEGFAVPSDYFDDLNRHIHQKLNVGETKVIPLKSYKSYYYAAASVAAIVLMIFAINRGSYEELTFDNIANSDIDSYFENNDLDLSPYEIAEVLPIGELEINDILQDRFEDEQVLEYLDDNIEKSEVLNFEDDE